MKLFADPILLWRTIWIGGAILLIIPLSYVFRYRRSIRRRLKDIEDDFSRGLMVREKSQGSKAQSDSSKPSPRKEIRCLELNPTFVKLHEDQWNLVSLGEYLTSLRPQLPGSEDTNAALPKFIEHELEVTIGAFLIRALGRRLGAAVLPLLGIDNIDSGKGRIATSLASWWASHFIVSERLQQVAHVIDAGTLPVDLSDIIAMANLNQKFASSRMRIKPLELMRRGEVGYDPSFGKPLNDDEEEDGEENESSSDVKENPTLIPSPFVISKDWDAAISGMERLMLSKDTVKGPNTPNAESTRTSTRYLNPDDRSLPEPAPINQRLLPDLYLGWGDAKCTHTKREVIRNRLIVVLLNKLSYNFYKKEREEQDLFAVKMSDNSRALHYPQEFLKALIDSGHTIEMCPKSQITTFGLQLCIKEDDSSWTYVPIGLFLRSGYERKDSRPAHYLLPHGGIDLRIRGPLLGSDQRCDIQFYMAIDGMCGWHSDHNAEVPWIQKTMSTKVYTNEEALLAMKLAAILAVTFNALGTEMDLPFGGYGTLGVCNDTGAMIDLAVRDETNMHPLVSTGRFLMHTGRRLIRLYKNIKQIKDDTSFGTDIRRLINASCNIQSDLLASPQSLIQSSKRYLASQPETPVFEIEVESKTIMTDLLNLFEQFDENIENVFRELSFST